MSNQLRQATQQDLEPILSYLRQDIPNCLYPYIDILVYGLENPNMKIWFDEDEEGPRLVAVQYHQSYQLYANRRFEDLSGFVELIQSSLPSGISGRRELIEALFPLLPQDTYEAEYGVIFRHVTYSEEELDYFQRIFNPVVSLAGPEDCEEIAQLICQDPELGGQYQPDLLAKQLIERIETGMGRSYVIRSPEGKIIAHQASFAEAPGVAVTSGLVILPQYRETDDCFNAICHYPSLPLQLEGKTSYYFCINHKMIKFLKRKKAEVPVAEYGKLILKP